ncbi:glycosyltransferase family 8 protein [Plicaturopsis crispa FD-325 SS-3]|nr:glycosyltransferase family 8 protein [Plicaturopsis crispa FD-325 SS-3]
MPRKAAYVTLLTKAAYLPGALVVAHTLRAAGAQYPLVVMVTPQLPQAVRDVLSRRGIAMREVDSLYPEEGKHQLAGHDARFGDTWTKLRAFELAEFERIVLLDSDMIIKRNMDELMDLELSQDWIASAHACACNPRKLAHYPADCHITYSDTGEGIRIPANCAYTPLVHPSALTTPTSIEENSPRPYGLLNSGLVVLTPSAELADAIKHYLASSPLVPTFSFPDQDLLAAFFARRWKPLPWCYNALKTLRVIHAPLWRDDEVRCLHYILDDKPWQKRVGEKGTGGEYEELNRWWWDALEEVGAELRKDGDKEGWALVEANVAPA